MLAVAVVLPWAISPRSLAFRSAATASPKAIIADQCAWASIVDESLITPSSRVMEICLESISMMKTAAHEARPGKLENVSGAKGGDGGKVDKGGRKGLLPLCQSKVRGRGLSI